MAQSNQPATRIDRKIAIAGNTTLVYGLPTVARSGQAAMVNRHIFCDRETVMGFETVEVGNAVHAGPGSRIR